MDRRWHLLTAAAATAALALQLVLVVRGGQVLDEVEPPALPLRLARFVAYFTIQSNVLVAVVSAQLARDPGRDGATWRVLRLAAVVGITVTGLVHFVLLRPLLDLEGADWVADKMLHMVVPVLAVAGWVAFGPRPRVTGRVAALTLVWPVGWLVVTLLVGAMTGWYPYPFLDHREDGAGAVVVACLGVTVLFVALLAAASALDRRLAPRRTADSPS
ncbi:Pr6Pr family membrane protein [Nocardioides rubriscoriae]|uniref:Pr6Pr family membrane protein n=1 Tax=Nocardioides rubriscoriae TaxID=642762 RepID=UPI001478ABC5|nr:Pr6Pr family membrane protein [Nocardioides rubriscoriae]